MSGISQQVVPFAAEDRFILVGIRDAEKIHLLIEPEDQDAADEMQLATRGFKVLPFCGHIHSTALLDLEKFRGSRDESVVTTSPLEVAASDLYITFLEPRLKNLFQFNSSFEIENFLQKELPDDLVSNLLSKCLYEIENKFSNITLSRMATSFRHLLPSIASELNYLLGSPSSLRRTSHKQDFDFADLQVLNILIEHVRASYFYSFISELHKNSLMVEFAMCLNGDSITCVPYHSFATHNIELPHKNKVIIARPGIVAKRTSAIFTEEIEELDRLINDSATQEKDIQRFFEDHQNFLRGLNYKNIYPQLVLERDNGQGSLIPDFILEPFDGDWCDILDIKLPKQKVVVGRNDRQSLASGIHEVAAQLREYAAYFEQDRYRQFAKEKYGLNVYKPRLIALVGRDLEQMSSLELRRTLTTYSELTVLTFDKLIHHARNHLLI